MLPSFGTQVERQGFTVCGIFALGLQIAQSRSYLYTLGPKVGSIYILGALGLGLKSTASVSSQTGRIPKLDAPILGSNTPMV